MLTAKKPKTAIYTLIAVILVTSLAGCACNPDNEEPSPELSSVAQGHVQNDNKTLSIITDVGDSIPQAVKDYAVDYTQTRLSYYTDELGYDITEAKIVGLTQINTGTAGLDNGIDMYLLEYRFLAENPDKTILADGMKFDGDCITEWISTGQPYLLLHWQKTEGETVWERICVTDTDTITQNYGTSEMEELYGNMYTAAAMELYAQRNSTPR